MKTLVYLVRILAFEKEEIYMPPPFQNIQVNVSRSVKLDSGTCSLLLQMLELIAISHGFTGNDNSKILIQ